MHKTKSTLFETLSWLTKAKKAKPDQPFEAIFILNRWLSMANFEYAQIVNVTGNRWLKVLKNFPFNDFYKTILPKHSEKIEYLKKSTKNSDNIEYKTISENMECSIKDIIFLEKSLEEINNLSK